MNSYAELLREAAREIKRPLSEYGRDLIGRLKAAAEEMDSELAELREQEPVAWMTEHDKHPTQFELHDPFEHTPEAIEKAMQSRRLLGWRLTPLYLAPQAAVILPSYQADDGVKGEGYNMGLRDAKAAIEAAGINVIFAGDK